MRSTLPTASGTVPVMPEPVFTETMQIGIVVRDLDATVRRYVEDYGIGPWQLYDVTAEKAPDLRHYGNPNIGMTRCATAKVGGVWWELIEPVGDEGIFARFLAEKGEGVHHIAVKTPNYDEAVAKHRPEDLPLSGSFLGIEVAYLPTDSDLGVLLEVFKGDPGAVDASQE